MKLSADFPYYYKGSDIDVFCYNKDEFAKLLLSVGNSYLDQGLEIKVSNRGKSQTYIDFYFDDELEFRFDLYQSLPEYKKIKIKEHFLLSIIENAVPLNREFDGINYPIYVPSEIDDIILRYIEYIEWYEIRPDKIKHLDYIVSSVSSNSHRIRFIDKLHLYTELPDPVYEAKTKKTDSSPVISYIKRLKRIFSKFPLLPYLFHLVKTIIRKIYVISGISRY